MQHETVQGTVVAAIYTRSAMQCLPSIDSQTLACLEAIESKHWVVAKDFIFTDNGASGSSSDRPGLKALLSAAKNRPLPFNYVVIDTTDRLGRKLGDVLAIAQELNSLGVHLYCAAQQLDGREYEPFRQMLIMQGMLCDQFRVTFSHAVHRGMEGKIRAGLSAGGRCFGYRGVPAEDATRRGVQGRPAVQGYRYGVFEPEAELVRRIFDWAGEGLGRKSIAGRCNAEGLLRSAPREIPIQSGA